MTEIRETSYYEIALTNRQVLTVFVILLACLVAAFLSGVWIGRRGESMPVDTVAAQTITSGVAAGEEPLGELRFFSEDAGPSEAEGKAPAKRERRASTPSQAAEEAPQTGAGEAPTRSPAPAPAAVPASPPAERTPAPAAASPPDPAAAAPAAPQPAPASPPPAAEAPAPVPRTLVVIQVFSSNDRAQAERVVERLRTAGLPALLAPVEVSGRTMYRVRIGPYRDPDQAQAVADRVRKEFRLDTWIID